MNKIFILGAALLFTQNNQAAISKKSVFRLKKENITIAVIDTGADIKHKDLQQFIWINEGETGKDFLGHDKGTNGIDDDDNGFVDDVHGWNFVNNTNDVSDSHGHGTHISGIIKKEFQKHYPSSSSTLFPSVRLMILKYYSPKATDSENIKNTVKAIEYATLMQAQIINYSGGGGGQYYQEYLAIKNAGKKNIVFIAAAGNSNSNTDDNKYYPANYPLDNILSVAATDNSGELVPFSNYGGNSVDIAAPGKQIYSMLPNNSYGFMSGTSQATAFVTGVTASLMAKNKNQNLNEIRTQLLSACKFNKSLKGKTKFQMAMTNSL